MIILSRRATVTMLGIRMMCAIGSVLFIVSCASTSASKRVVIHESHVVGAWCSPIQWDWYGYRLVFGEDGHGFLASDYASPASSTSTLALCRFAWKIGPRGRISFTGIPCGVKISPDPLVFRRI